MSVAPISIRLNGEIKEVPAGISISGLLQLAGYGERRVAIERNGEIVPRSQHLITEVAANDRIEIVQAIGGG
ncbi:MAG: sulfur carrier protein ThiS [Xanthomonadales bacterium]|nr:sulfur carrier protein ThiS [Xanthomonadales bacterium]